MSHIKNDHTFVQQFQGRDETEAEINARGIRSYRITVSVHSQNALKKVDNIWKALNEQLRKDIRLWITFRLEIRPRPTEASYAR
jgi:hypothetical protein